MYFSQEIKAIFDQILIQTLGLKIELVYNKFERHEQVDKDLDMMSVETRPQQKIKAVNS